MSKRTQEMKDMIGSQQCFMATVGKDGLPNVAPKRSTRVFNDAALIFTEGTGCALRGRHPPHRGNPLA